MLKYRIAILSVVVLGLVVFANGAENTKLVYLTHWGVGIETPFKVGVYDEEGRLIAKGLDHYVQEYMALHPGIEIEVISVQFAYYFPTLLTRRAGGEPADIYGLYSLWGVQLVLEGALDSPPEWIVEDALRSYPNFAIKGAMVNGKLWGIPMEVNNLALIYNKKLFAEAGITKPPHTWDELVEAAVALTKPELGQYGIAFDTGWDTAVVHPFYALLFSLGGKPFSDDFKYCLLTSPEALAALNATVELFRRGATSTAVSSSDFLLGKVAMVFHYPWWENTLRTQFGDEFEEIVGVAPFPRLGDIQATTGYTWFFGVDSLSPNKQAAWDFLRWWLCEVREDTGTTRYGEFVAKNLKVIPPRECDFQGYPEHTYGPYTRVFVEQLPFTIPEPNLAQGAQIKSIIWEEILNTWSMLKSPEKALQDACARIQPILDEFYGGR